MTSITFTMRLQGVAFSPAEAETRSGLAFTMRVEPGTIVSSGRYSGSALPYGWAELRCDADAHGHPGEKFFFEASILAGVGASCGATQRVLHIEVAYQDQCNFEWSCESLSAVARLGLPVTVSCFQAPH